MKNQLVISVITFGMLSLSLIIPSGCQHNLYDASKATRTYPEHLHQRKSIDIQVFRDGENIELHNATANSYSNFDLWINQRYVATVETLPAGGKIKLSLWNFYDERGEVINAGGIWAVEAPMPVRLVEIQQSTEAPMIGLITIRDEADEY